MSPAPTRKRSPSHEAQPARWRALRTAGAALPRAPREQGGGPRSRAPTRPPRANLPPRGPQPDKAARWMAATAPALQWRARRMSPALQDSTKGTAQGNPKDTHGPRQCLPSPQTSASAWFAACFCHSRGLPLSWAGWGQGAGRATAAWLPIGPRLPQRCAQAMAARLGVCWLPGKRSQRKADICIGRQQGSLFPAPLHSTV
jgi:hypothetical protein